ncbi:MAG: hypothetical protein MUC49_00835 [Raineya sp.]|jgi:hypothetical protein|nr:hypothetical protein [Raineya sp.]
MRNPIRRNQNIGTSKQGAKKQSIFSLPFDSNNLLDFYEKLSSYQKLEIDLGDKKILFVVEGTKKDFIHACSIEDVVYILKSIDFKYWKTLEMIVLRQPKKKEVFISPVWGRLIYSYSFENQYKKTIVLESVNCFKKLKWSKKLHSQEQKELERLRKDGHFILEQKNYYEIQINIDSARNTQLYRTLLHEIGHLYHFAIINEETYKKLPSSEKEYFAHQFSDELKKELEEQQIIPFKRKLNTEFLQNYKLNQEDFEILELNKNLNNKFMSDE